MTSWDIFVFLGYGCTSNYRIQGHSFPYHWITKAVIVICLFQQKILANLHILALSGPVFCSYATLFPSLAHLLTSPHTLELLLYRVKKYPDILVDRAKPTTINHINWFITQRRKKECYLFIIGFSPSTATSSAPTATPSTASAAKSTSKTSTSTTGWFRIRHLLWGGKKIRLKFAHKFYLHQRSFWVSIPKTKVGRFHWLEKPKSFQQNYRHIFISKSPQRLHKIVFKTATTS